jgi:hypothetical protein
MKMAPYFCTTLNTLHDDVLDTIKKYVDRSGGGIDFKDEHVFSIPSKDETLSQVSGIYTEATGVSDVLHVRSSDGQTWEEDLADMDLGVLIDVVKTIEVQEGYEI